MRVCENNSHGGSYGRYVIDNRGEKTDDNINKIHIV